MPRKKKQHICWYCDGKCCILITFVIYIYIWHIYGLLWFSIILNDFFFVRVSCYVFYNDFFNAFACFMLVFFNYFYYFLLFFVKSLSSISIFCLFVFSFFFHFVLFCHKLFFILIFFILFLRFISFADFLPSFLPS